MAHPVRAGLAALAVFLLLAGAGLGSVALWLEHHLTSSIGRLDGVFDGLPNRPPLVLTGAGADAVNILLLGTDRRSDVATTGSAAEDADWLPGEQRSDTIAVLHISADRRSAAVISIPRDSWVEVPDHGKTKVNAAYSLGGAHLAVKTVESLTGVRIDHVAVVDWAGFAALVDTVHGINVWVPRTVEDSHSDVTWKAGIHHLDGSEALLYVRQRYGLPAGDLDRVRRQQVALRELARSSLQAAMYKNPVQLYDFLDEGV